MTNLKWIFHILPKVHLFFKWLTLCEEHGIYRRHKRTKCNYLSLSQFTSALFTPESVKNWFLNNFCLPNNESFCLLEVGLPIENDYNLWFKSWINFAIHQIAWILAVLILQRYKGVKGNRRKCKKCLNYNFSPKKLIFCIYSLRKTAFMPETNKFLRRVLLKTCGLNVATSV